MLEFTQHAYSLRTRILVLVFLAFFTASNGLIDLHSNACTDEQLTRNRKSFNFRSFGNASGLEQCVDFCCRDDICELAIFSRGFHCYGVSCDEPELCHKILDRLLMEDERQLQRSTRNAGARDFIRHTSQVTNPRCPKRFVPSFNILLLDNSSPHEFRKLRQHSDVGSGQCSAQCCKSRDCLLSFVEDEECYGVTAATTNSTKAIQEPSISLQVAVIDRNKEVSRSLDDEDEDPDDLGSDDSDVKQEAASQTQTKTKHPSPKVDVKVQTTLTNKTSSITNSPKTVTKTNDSNVSKKRYFKVAPTKGDFQRAHNITKLRVVHSSVGKSKIHSKASTKKRIMRPDIKLLPTSKGHLSHITSVVTQRRTINPKSVVKLPEANFSSPVKPLKGASPSKAKPTAKVAPAAKGGKTADLRRGAKSTNTGGYSKIKNEVKHLEQTKKTLTVKKAGRASSRALKTGKTNKENTLKSSVAKINWHIPRFTEGSTKGSANGDDEWSGENDNLGREHKGFSGDDLDLSGNDKFLGMEYKDFSGENSDLSGDDDVSSGEDATFIIEHNDFRGENKGLRGDDEDSSEKDRDLMEENAFFSGKDKAFSEDRGDVQKISHNARQEKSYAGENKEGQTNTKIDLVKDLDELGSDEDENKEQSKLASGNVPYLPQRKHVEKRRKTKKNNKMEGYGEMESKRVNIHSKQQKDRERKQASVLSSKRKSRTLGGKVRLKNGVSIETRPRQSGLVKLTTKKNNASFKQLKSRKDRKIKTRDSHKKQRMIKSAVATTKPVQSTGLKTSSGQNVKPKAKNRDTEATPSLSIRRQSGMSDQGKINTKNKQVTNSTKSKISKPSLSRKTLKVISPAYGRKTSLNAIGTVHNHTTVLSPKRKMESVKDELSSQKHLKSKDESFKSESIPGNSNVKDDNTKTKHRKSLESETFQGSHILQSKKRQLKRGHKKLNKSTNNRTISQKEGDRKFTNSNSTLEDTRDLMHYAHRKVYLERKPSVNRRVQRYMPTKRKATFVKTTSRLQDETIPKESPRNNKTNRSETAQAKRSYVHPKVRALQKERKSPHAKPTTSKHSTTTTLNKRTHDKLVGHKSLVTTPRTHSHHALALQSTNKQEDVPSIHPTTATFNKRTPDKLVGHKSLATIPKIHSHHAFGVLSTNKPEDASSNENVSLASHRTFSSSPQIINKATNSTAPIYTSKNALLSIKQRSNINTSNTKASFLAHFHQAENNGSDGVEFSVKSHGKHHRRKAKHEEAIDVEDLGDADFDIMMSNDIPHKDLPKKAKDKKRDHKHTEKDEGKQRHTKDDVREKKNKKGSSHQKEEEDDTDESEKSSAKTHSSKKHHDKIEIEKSATSKHHHYHHHHYHHEDDADKDQDESKEAEKKFHQHHRKHVKSADSEEEDSESKNRHHNTHKKHSHLVKKIENDDGDDDSNSVENIHAKHHHKKAKTGNSREDDSENDREKEHRHHHKHKKHYDDNHWEGKIIPGKVKLTYDEDSGKKRHHKHRTQDDNESFEKKEHHGSKHTLKENEFHSDSDSDMRKHHRHSKKKTLHNHEHEDDEYDKNEGQKEYREDDQAKHQGKDRHKHEERAEKRTDVNYEVVKKDRHRLVYKENDDDDDSESSKRKNDNDDDDNSDEKQNSDYDSGEDKGSADGEDGNDENTSHNRVVLGEDSENDDEDEEKHAEERPKSHNRHEHGNKHRHNERDDPGYDVEDHDSTSHEEDHKPTFHSRYELERHRKTKHKHYESHEKSNTDDDSDDNQDDFKNSRRNFRKSFIYHRTTKKQRRLRQHHEKERDREEEYNKDNEDEEFHVHKQHPDEIYKRRHYHYRPRDGNDSDKTEKYEELKETPGEDSYRHGEGAYERNHKHYEEKIRDHEKQRAEKFRFRDQMKNQMVEFEDHNGKHFHYKKERHHGNYISRERDHDERKFKDDSHDRNFPGFPHRHEQDEYKNSFREGERPADDDVDHHTDYNEDRKYVARHRKEGNWKHRHFHDDDEQDLEGTGGLFDSSAWMRDETSEDDHYYGGEGNQEYYRHKKRKHKHRKHRQSYEYWAYREQNPYYYNYNYRKSRPWYGYYKLQPTVRPPHRWHKYHYGGYGRWKPRPTSWYSNKEHWDRKPSWRSFRPKPTVGYQWHTFYSDRGITNQHKPTPYPIEPSHAWPPTNPRRQQPDQSQRGFGGDTWSPGHSPGPEKQYNNWSRNGPSALLNQGEDNYRPQQNTPGMQPSRGLVTYMPDHQQQPQGVQPNYVSPTQPNTSGVVSQTRYRPTVRRQYQAPPPSQVSSPTNISQIKSIMDKLNTPPSAVGGPKAGSVPNVNPGLIQNTSNDKNGILRTNLTSGDQIQDKNRLNGFFNEENGGKKKSEIVKPANSSHGVQAAKNTSSSANSPHHVQQTPPSITSTPVKPLHPTQVANTTTIRYTTPTQAQSNHTSKPTEPTQNGSTTVTPTQRTTVEQTPAGPNFGDVSQPDDSSGKKHRKHRAPVCIAGKTTDDVTLLRGKGAGNFTNIGDVGDFEMCIKRCCQHQKCDLAFKSAETCFLVNCFSKESCQTSPSLDDIFSPRMCFVTRHLKDDEKDTPGQDRDDEWNDKVSPSGIREVCDVEKALGLLWKKTIAGRYSAHPCPRGAKGFVKRRCEADSRWLPPDFSECVSKDYQTLFDKSKKLATGADPSPLIRELSQLTTQNIDNSLIFGGDLDRATDIMAAIVQHNGQTELIDMTREDVENFVRASSNLLDMTNLQEWFNIQKNKPGTADVLRSMEMFALQAAMRLPREDMAEPLVTNNIIIKMDRKSPGDGGLTFPDFSNSKISRWDARHDVIALPSSVFDRGEVSTASISFKSLPYLLPDSNVSTGLGPNSKVISTVLHPHPQEKITPPVTVVLSHIKRRRGNPKCVFWDYTLNPHRGGAWSSRGCWLAFSNHSHSICQCSHLSNFAVLMDLSSDEVSQKEQKRERTMALMWIGIPVLIVGVIGGLYMSFSWNRKSGMPTTVTRPSAALNEKTGLLGQRVVTSQIREEFPASPTRDLYRALSPGYSPTGDLEWQDEFDFEMEYGDQGFKQMLLPKLQMLQKQLINEFYDGDNMETKKKKLLESKLKQKSKITAEILVQTGTDDSVNRQTIQQKPQIQVQSPIQSDVESAETVNKQKERKIQANPQMTPDTPVQCKTVRTVNRQATQEKSQIASDRQIQSQTLKIARRQMKTSSGRKLRVRFADEKPPGRNLTDEDKERFKRLQRMERRVFFQHLSRWTAHSHLNLSD